MDLSSSLISEFVKITSDNSKVSKESTVYGTVVIYDDLTYVKLDGSDQLTPIRIKANNTQKTVDTTADVRNGERVTVLIKNHTATITGNLESPAARIEDVETMGGKISEFESIVTNTVTAEQLAAQIARIDNLETDNATIKETLTAANADINYLKTNMLTAESIEGKYANVDFSNIGKAAMEHFYASSGLIKDVVVEDATITGELAGVTISGDLIKANTVKAEKLVIKGSDGLYCKLNTDGVTVEAEQTEENSLNGSVILAKSITATKISVYDLVAFDATIGGFNITENSIYSGVKESVGNTTRGIYLDNDGQISFGDSSNYIKYYKDQNGNYKLDISANTVVTSNGVFGRRTSSSERYKRDISVSDISELSGLYDLPVKKFKYNNDYISSDDELYDKYLYGFVVEDLEDILPCAVEHVTDEEGNTLPEMWNSNILVPALLKLIQDLNDRVKVLEGKEAA